MRPAALAVVLLAICWLAELGCSSEINERTEAYRIAVIGAGIGGSSFSYQLAKRFPSSKVGITVFEKNDHVCGRVHNEVRPLGSLLRTPRSGDKESDDEDVVLELGGTIYHEVNSLIKGMASELGLRAEDEAAANTTNQAPDERLGIWTGKEFGFASPSGDSLIEKTTTAANFFWRYGPYSIYRAHQLLDSTVDRYLSTYGPIEQGSAVYTTLREYVRAMNIRGEAAEAAGFFASLSEAPQLDMETLVTQSLCDVLEKELGVSRAYTREFASAVVRVQYNQDCSLNGLVGLVGLFPVVDDRCHRIHGGNMQMCQRMLHAAQVQLRTSSSVHLIEQQEHGYLVHYQVDSQRPVIAEAFDVVVLASPLELSGIHFSDSLGLSSLEQLNHLPRREYQRTRVTMVAGEPNPAYFGLSSLDQLPDCILTVADESIPFTSMCINRWVDAADPHWNVYKIFSEQEVTDSLLDSLFTSWRLVLRKDWWAYPKLQPNPRLLDEHNFQLRPSLFYISAMESIMSTMETEALSALNVVNLVARLINEQKASNQAK